MFSCQDVVSTRVAVMILFVLLVATGSASSQTYVRKSNDNVWIDWRFIRGWSVDQVEKTFAPSGEIVHISTPIALRPATNTPKSPPKTPIDPWCDCPEEYRRRIGAFLSSVSETGDRLPSLQVHEKSGLDTRLLEGLKRHDQRIEGFKGMTK